MLVVGADDVLDVQLFDGQLSFGPNGSETALFSSILLTIGPTGSAQLLLDAGGTYGLTFNNAGGGPVGAWLPGNGDIAVYDSGTGHLVAQIYNDTDEGTFTLAAGGVQHGYWDAGEVQFFGAAGLAIASRPAVPTQVATVSVSDFNTIRTAMIALGIWTDGD